MKPVATIYRANNSRGMTAPCIPYMGGKRAIADDIVEALPRCENFLDACCGGGAVGYSMLAFGRAGRVTMNDIQRPLIDLHRWCAAGDIDFEAARARWVSREEFFAAIERVEQGVYSLGDVIAKWLWSFGYGGRNYLYGAEVETWKKLAHDVIFATSADERHTLLRRLVRHHLAKIDLGGIRDVSEPVNRLKSLEKLSGLRGDVAYTSSDIFEIDYTPYDLVYFDPPYANTGGRYGREFDHAAFWELFASLTVPAYASEYTAPAGIKAVKEMDKRTLFSKTNTKGGAARVVEKLYWNGR